MDGLNWSSLVEPHTCNAAADGRVRRKLMKMAWDGQWNTAYIQYILLNSGAEH